ncbi:hypothetical protein GCM10028801_28730 [Nocardioides maradonensis]
MTFTIDKVPGGDIAAWGRECRDKALAGAAEGDPRAVHDWTKSWIGWGGGAWLPDPWILYTVAGLLEGKPRIAVHSLDIAIRTWLAGASDRAALTWLRGMVISDRLNDPKTALIDLRDAAAQVPGWMTVAPDQRLEECESAAATSRKRVASVKPRPAHVGASSMVDVVAPPVVGRMMGRSLRSGAPSDTTSDERRGQARPILGSTQTTAPPW